MLNGSRQHTQYGADMSTDITLSTGVNIGRIPMISSRVGAIRTGENSWNRLKLKESITRSSPDSDDVIRNLGITSNLSEQGAKEEIDASHTSEVTTLALPAANLGSLGGLQVQMKYIAASQELSVSIKSAIQLPARFHSSDSKLYVKVCCNFKWEGQHDSSK